MLLADRFLHAHDSWFDIATGRPVQVVIERAGSLSSQIAWAERCAMLVRLRHTLLNPLIDFGVASQSTVFEAYEAGEPVAVSAKNASDLVTHLSRFLDAHGVPLTANRAALMVRPLRYAPHARRARPAGFVLQPRAALHVVFDVLGGRLPGGTTCVRITGPPGSGLRTVGILAAQTARVDGYVPVSPRAIVRWPALLDVLADRHVCVIADGTPAPAERAALVSLITRWAPRNWRPHVHLTLQRSRPVERGAVRLAPLGVRTMSTMIYIDQDYGPTAEEIFDAAREADGWPGPFLENLGVFSATAPPPPCVVHESSIGYAAVRIADAIGQPAKVFRVQSVLLRARDRASGLEGRGRHAAATRLLNRAARVLHARGETGEAAECWLQLAWLARNRGATTEALQYAERAGQASPVADVQLRSTWLSAVCWTDEARLLEAEASLRNLVVAASDAGMAAMRQRCVLALARVLYWQARSPESLALVLSIEVADGELGCEAALLEARALVAMGDVPAGLKSARTAAQRAAALADLRLQAGASRALAEALCAAGDLDGVRTHVSTGLQLCSAAHRPLAALALRVVLLRALSETGSTPEESRLLRSALQRAMRRRVPALLRTRIDAACSLQRNHPSAGNWPSRVAFGQLETLLDLAQRQKDDVEAVRAVVACVCDQVGAAAAIVVAAADGRVVATAGRPWRERSIAAAQALASGRSAEVRDEEPHECAEPVRCGSELLGAIACRWLAGRLHAPGTASAALRAASMAVATHLRTVLDTPAEQPPGVWSDLLGESQLAQALREAVQRASRAPFPVLIEGESGSGKELVARAIHKLGPRHHRRFCAINCAALSDELVEAELFGHTRGAFTGASAERAGLFEEADGGTLFLDEVGELSSRAQAKLLRVLQEGEVRRVGENVPRRVDVRIVAATNRQLEQEAAHGRFRHDLRFRLDVLRIVVPPLRERSGDVPLLAQHFWRQACARVGSRATLGPDALAALSRYDWPGNVRELQNAIAWIAVHAPRRGRVSAEQLPAQLASSPIATGSFEAAREEFERRFVRAALAQAGGHRQRAARALGVSRQGLAKMLRRLRIEQS
jgi:DNA-binding NtrC family response regulator